MDAPDRLDLPNRGAAAADATLARVTESFDFLRLVSPINGDYCWEVFQAGGASQPPEFLYAPLPLDPESALAEVAGVDCDVIEDPELGALFAARRAELLLELEALQHRGRPNFRHLAEQIYGVVDVSLRQSAIEWLRRLPAADKTGAADAVEVLDCEQFIRLAEDERGGLQRACPEFTFEIQRQPGLAAHLMVSRGALLVDPRLKLTRRAADAFIQHEIGVHLVTRFNGEQQPWRLFANGLAGYDGLQEGLAVLMEFLAGPVPVSRWRELALRVVAVDAMLSGADFVETCRQLSSDYDVPLRAAFQIAVRVHRGGGLPKDAAYLRGFLELCELIRSGVALQALFIGKVSTIQWPDVWRLLQRHQLRPPALLPTVLDVGTGERLDRVRQITISDEPPIFEAATRER